MKSPLNENRSIICKFLGTNLDPATSYGYPSDENFCYHCKVPTSPSSEHQQNFCLKRTHTDCQVFTQDANAPFPIDAIAPQAIIQKSNPTKIAILAVVGLLIVVGLSFAISQVIHSRQQSVTPTSSATPIQETPLSILIPVTGESPTYTQTSTITFTKTSLSTATPSPSSDVTATLTTSSPSVTGSLTLTNTMTPSKTKTATRTNTPSRTPTKTFTRTSTPSQTATKKVAPTSTASQTVTKTHTRTPSITSSPTKTRTPSPTSTITKTSTPSRTNTNTALVVITLRPSTTPTLKPHSLELPVTVNDRTFFIHMVTSGENYEMLARTYNTSVDSIVFINYIAPSPLWIKSTIVISPGMTSPDSTLPAFEIFQVIENPTDIDSIANRFGVDAVALKQYNNCRDNCRLIPGDWLLIPHAR